MKILDGAMGTMIQALVSDVPKYAETLNTLAPEAIRDIHRRYVEAGSEILCTNTFTCNGLKAAAGKYDLKKTVAAAIENARRAAPAGVAVALDVGPLGEFLEPYGNLSEAEARRLFRELGEAGMAADLFYIETMADLREARLAAESLREADADTPIFATFTFSRAGKTITGLTPAEAARGMDDICAAVGINCSLGPVEALELVCEFKAASSVPIIAKPNAGMPDSRGQYSLSPKAFAEAAIKLRDAGAEYIGGCCGTDPSFISALKSVL